MSLVLGIASSHDSSACLFNDGELVSAIAEERLSRIKCDGGALPQRAIDHVLAAAGATRRDVDHIASIYGHFPERYFRRETAVKEFERRLSRALRIFLNKPKDTQFSAGNLLKHLRERGGESGEAFDTFFRRAEFLAGEGFRHDANIHFFDHHLTHAAAAAFYSGFDAASVVTMDGEGDLDMHHGSYTWQDGRLQGVRVSDTVGNSPGYFYMAITELLGFMPLRHEGKVLGLAAFGNPMPLAGALRRALRPSADGKGFDSDFAGRSYDEREAYIAEAIRGHPREDVAAAAQQVFEEAIVALVRNFVAETGLRRLALNGGCFANVKLNQRLAALPEVDEVFVFPGMSDTGNSVGAGLLMLDRLQPGFIRDRRRALETVYWGPEYTDAQIEEALKGRLCRYEKLTEEQLIERSARAMHAGKVLGWFQGRMEFGPRALGNRSMLAAPTDRSINKWLNERLERTEFMPFAPSVLDEYAEEIFEGVPKARHTAEFMTITFDVKRDWRERIPAVVHVDGTARPQLVRRDRNPRYHALIERYRQLSGIPLVLNTSFNVHEEPIVCAPEEAVRALAEGRIDHLAIGNFWAETSSGKGWAA